MNLNQIQYFIAVAEFSSISKAAEHLHISQPTISESIKSLEQELGVQLFKRIKQRIHITQNGRYYYDKVKNIYGDLLDLNNEVSKLASTNKKINIGIPPMIGSFIFPKLYVDSKNFSSKIIYEICEGGSIELLDQLENETLDMAIIAKEIGTHNHETSLTYHTLSYTQIHYCVSKNHRFSKKKSITLKDIAEQEQLILFKEGYLQNKIIIDALSKNNLYVPIVLRTNQLHTITTFIEKNIATSFFFKEFASGLKNIVAIPLEKELPLEIAIVWKTNRFVYKDIQLLSDFLQKNVFTT